MLLVEESVGDNTSTVSRFPFQRPEWIFLSQGGALLPYFHDLDAPTAPMVATYVNMQDLNAAVSRAMQRTTRCPCPTAGFRYLSDLAWVTPVVWQSPAQTDRGAADRDSVHPVTRCRPLLAYTDVS